MNGSSGLGFAGLARPAPGGGDCGDGGGGSGGGGTGGGGCAPGICINFVPGLPLGAGFPCFIAGTVTTPCYTVTEPDFA